MLSMDKKYVFGQQKIRRLQQKYVLSTNSRPGPTRSQKNKNLNKQPFPGPPDHRAVTKQKATQSEDRQQKEKTKINNYKQHCKLVDIINSILKII